MDYVNLSGNQIVAAGAKTYHKRMKIFVTDTTSAGGEPLFYRWQDGEKIKDTLSVSFVNSYWFYN